MNRCVLVQIKKEQYDALMEEFKKLVSLHIDNGKYYIKVSVK